MWKTDIWERVFLEFKFEIFKFLPGDIKGNSDIQKSGYLLYKSEIFYINLCRKTGFM